MLVLATMSMGAAGASASPTPVPAEFAVMGLTGYAVGDTVNASVLQSVGVTQTLIDSIATRAVVPQQTPDPTVPLS